MIIDIYLLVGYCEIVYEFTLITNTVIFACYVSYNQRIFGDKFVPFVKKKHTAIEDSGHLPFWSFVVVHNVSGFFIKLCYLNVSQRILDCILFAVPALLLNRSVQFLSQNDYGTAFITTMGNE